MKRARQSFAKTGQDGLIFVVNEEDVYADDHPYVEAWPELFADLEDVSVIHRAPGAMGVEQATASPGELRRGPGRPRKYPEA